MSDLSYTIEVRGAKDLDKLSNTIDKLHGVLNAGQGSGKSLEELRRIIVGMKGSASVFTDLKQAVVELNSSAKSLRTGFQSSIKELQSTIKTSMAEAVGTMRTAGLEQGKALADGIEASTPEAVNAIKRQGRSMAAAARAESTKMYENMVMGNPNAKVTDRGLAALLGLEGAGATLSPYHKNIVRQMRESGKRGNAAIVAAVKAEQDELQSALQSLEARSKNRQASLGSVYSQSLSQGKADVARVKANLALERKELENAVSNETAQLQAALKAMESRGAARSASLATVYANSIARGKEEVARVKTNLAAERKAIEETVAIEGARLQATLKAMEERGALRSASLSSIYANSLAKGKSDISRVKAELTREATAIEAAVAEQQARIRKSVSSAMNMPAGVFQRYNAGTGIAGAVVGETAAPKLPKPKDLNDTGRALKGLGDNMNYTHSMARGLASGFNLLWLTWGDLAPLFLGAALSNGFMQTAKLGMDVAHTFAIIENVGGNTRKEVEALTAQMILLANQGPFGPREIAEAMKTLSLAGLQANDILRVTGDVLNFSVAGTTTIEKAAETLIQVSTAFGMGASGFGYASDVISKAAADSMTSVEAFSNAMKTASVIGQQYGVSLQDTALGIGTLANLGIQATAAGTALRNMYADLSGRSIKVSKILATQKIEMRNLTDGGFRPMIEVVAELNEKLLKMDPISAKNFMQALLSERGAKGLVEMLRLIRTEARDMGKGFNNALEEVRAGMENNAAFAAITAAKMSQTAQNQFKTMGSVLQASLFQAYQSLEPQLVLIFQRMQEAFGSPEFISTITSLVSGIATLGKVMADHAGILVTLAIAYAALKTAQAGLLGVAQLLTAASTLFTRTKTTETVALVANTEAQLANAAASAGFAGGMSKTAGVLGTVARLIPYLNVALGVGTAAWMGYQFWASKSTDTAAEAADNYTNKVAGALSDEADKLAKINALRSTGISLAEAEIRVSQAAKSEEQMSSHTKGVNEARAAYEKAIEAQRKFTQTGQGGSGLNIKRSPEDTKRFATRLESDVNAAWNNLNKAVSAADAAGSKIKTQEDRLKEETKKRTKWLLDTQKEQADAVAGMYKHEETFTQADAGGGAKFQKLFVPFDNAMKMAAQRAEDSVTMQRKLAADEQKVLEAKHRVGLISEGEYQGSLLELVTRGGASQISEINKGQTEFLAAAEKKRLMLEGLYKGADPKNRETLNGMFEDLAREVVTYTEKATNSIAEINSATSTSIEVAALRAQGAIKRLETSTQEFWRKDQGEQNKARALFDLSQQYLNINDSVFSMEVAQRAAAQAGTEAMEKYATETERLNTALREAQAELAKLSPGTAAYDSITQLINRTKNAIDEMQTKAVEGAASAASLAFDKARADQAAKFNQEISGAITTALFEGGKAGRKKLRNIIVAELQKPITLYINAIVNKLTGGMMDQLAGGGQGGGLTGMYNMVSSAYKLFAGGGGSGLSGMLAGYMSEAGSLFGSSAMSEFAAGMSQASGTFSATTGSSTMVGGYSEAISAGSSGGAVAGTALNIAGGVAGGIYGGRFVSGGYAVGGGSGNTAVNTGTAIGAAVGSIFPVIGTALGALVGGLLGGLVNRLFGKKLTESGIEGTFGGPTGFEGTEYKFLKGGWFSGDKTERDPLNEGIRQGLAGQFQYLANTTQEMAAILGVSGDAVKNFSYSMKVNLKGLTEQEAAVKLEEEFMKMSEAMALTVLGTTAYSRVNETSMATLARLSSTLKTVNAAMGNLGGTLYETSIGGANAAQSLVDLFGGLEVFAGAMDAYYQNYYTEQERSANVIRDLTEAFKTLGITMPTSTAEFRKLVDQTLALGVAGQPTLVALMNMQQLFKDVFPEIEDKTEEMFDKHLKGVEKLIAETEKLKSAKLGAGSLVDRIDEAMGRPSGNYAFMREQELWSMIGGAKGADQVTMASELTDLVLARMQREKENLELQQQSQEEARKFWQDTLGFVQSLMTGSLSPLTNEQKLAAAQTDYATTYQKAVAGDVEAQGKLQASANTYLDIAKVFYASSQVYSDIFNAVTGGLADAAQNGILASQPGGALDPTVIQQESYDQLLQLRTISANAYDSLSAQLITAQSLLATELAMLEIEAAQLGRADEVKELIASLPAEIALAMPAFNASVFEQMGYNQARTLETLTAIQGELIQAREANTAEAHMQAQVYVEAMERMMEAMAELVSHATQTQLLFGNSQTIQ